MATTRIAILASMTLVLGCEAGPPQVEGVTTRVVGDTVTLTLTQGEANFAPGDEVARLIDADATVYASNAAQADRRLEVLEQDRKTVTIVVPAGAAPGTAALYLQREGPDPEFEVPLTIDRVALALSLGGTMSFSPVPPHQLVQRAFPERPLEGISLSPDGRTVAFISGNEIGFADVAKATRGESSPQFTRVRVDRARLVAALNNGAVVATDSIVSVLKHTATGVDESKLQISSAKALAVAENNESAVVLFECASAGSGPADAACITRIDLTATEPSTSPAIVLEAPRTASLVATSYTGQQVAVPAGNDIHGIDFDETPPQMSKLTWSDGAAPVGVDRATATIGNTRTDLFAVADQQGKRIRSFGFADGFLLFIQQKDATFDVAPGPISFGRGIDLYASAGGKLYLVDLAAGETPSITDLSIQVPSDVTTLAVQP